MNICSNEISNAVTKLANNIRAENINGDSYLSVFAGQQIIADIDNNNNQVIYGRRGSGKTHLLKAVQEKINARFAQEKNIAIYIDVRKHLPVIAKSDCDAETAALIIFQHIIQEIIDVFTSNIREIFSREQIAFSLDGVDEVRVSELSGFLSQIGVEIDGRSLRKLGDISVSKEDIEKTDASAKLAANPELTVAKNLQSTVSVQHDSSKYVSLFEIGKILGKTIAFLGLERVVCLLDEWSEIPKDTQTHLAELIKRAFITEKFSFKLAAIPNRTYLGHKTKDKFFGLEDGGDIFGIQLDNRYVFETNKQETRDFFNDLLFKHFSSIDTKNISNLVANEKTTTEKFINVFLTNKALGEILIASAGVPRDFIHLFIHSYGKFLPTKAKHISVKNIRTATSEWYETDKKKQVDDHPLERGLLEKIVQEIIINKKSTHFMISEKNSRNKHIQSLIDFRVLHLRKKGLSHQDIAGEAFNAFSIDYGCYNHLSITRSALTTDALESLNVHDDMREIRRIYLNDNFFENFSLSVGEAFNCPACKRPVDTNHLAYIKQSMCNHCFEKIDQK